MPEELVKKEIEYIKNHIKNTKIFNSNHLVVFGSEVRFPIMKCIDLKGSMTKKELYNLLVVKHKLINISYINISANVDILIKEGLLELDKTKQQYNQKKVFINIENFRKYMKENEKLFSMCFFGKLPKV
jgi:hypothetical protein